MRNPLRKEMLDKNKAEATKITGNKYIYIVKLFLLQMKIITIMLLVVCSYRSAAQKTLAKQIDEYATIDKIALQLQAADVKTTQDIATYVNAHFTNEKDKARAIFIWTASNITYDVPNMFALNFDESKQDKIDKTLKTKVGICENYAAIFNDVANKCGIKDIVIEGYTKQNGYTSYVPHAWCAAVIDKNWYLFDPTWGAGYADKGKFIKKINNDYFMASPSALIKSHMPFDPLWEFLNYRVTNQDFAEGKVGPDKSHPYFSYTDSIAAYEKQNEREQLAAQARRVENNGVNNALIFERLKYIKMSQRNETVNEYNLAVADYNNGLRLFNIFVNYYNNQFKPAKADAAIAVMIDTVSSSFTSSLAHLNHIQDADASTLAMIKSLYTSLTDAQGHVDEQKEFVAKYMDKSKLGRKMMFHKYTWMGIPVN